MSNSDVRQAILDHLRSGGHVTLFLDYDGTLVPIAPTPEEAVPDADLLNLLRQLSLKPSLRTVILSGRPLEDLEHMIPMRGIIMAGLYGVETRMGDSMMIRGPTRDGTRDSIVRVREGWARLAGGLSGFLLEDKGQAIAIHTRWADPEQADHVLAAARELAADMIDRQAFRILDGHRYVEVAPASADKGETVDWLLTNYPIADDLAVGFGDDNKDELAFAALHRRGGLAIGVGHRYELQGVDGRVETPEEVRGWLRSFIDETQNPNP